MSEMDRLVEEKFDEIWRHEITNRHTHAKPVVNGIPSAFVLGGQPGAGKFILLSKAAAWMQKNIIMINGDYYRKYHPNYAKFQSENIEISATKTAEFAGKMVEKILNKCIVQRYNVVIEGTFRTASTPLQTLSKFKAAKYHTEAMIQTCDKNLSWSSCLERFEKAKNFDPSSARATRKADHDKVVASLAQNAMEVYRSGLADRFRIFCRFLDDSQNMRVVEVFDSQQQKLKIEMLQNILG